MSILRSNLNEDVFIWVFIHLNLLRFGEVVTRGVSLVQKSRAKLRVEGAWDLVLLNHQKHSSEKLIDLVLILEPLQVELLHPREEFVQEIDEACVNDAFIVVDEGSLHC